MMSLLLWIVYPRCNAIYLNFLRVRPNKYLFQHKQLFTSFDPYLELCPNKIILWPEKQNFAKGDVHHNIMYGLKK